MRTVSIAAIAVLGTAAVATAQAAPDGEQIYTQTCARCHDDMPLLLTAAPIQEYSADRIYEQLTYGFMVRQAAGLTKDEQRAVAEFVSDSPTGRQLWKTYTITDEAQRTDTTSTGVQRWGPSGAGIWASPTLDPDNNVMYIATGDSYSQPADPGSDALMAVAMDTGRVLWTTQTFPGDAFTVACISTDPDVLANCPEDAGPDVDYGSAPVLTTGADGRRALLAGQKSGVMYSLDPENGEILWEARVADGGMLGGIEWGFASDGNAVYASTSDAFEEAPGEAGGLTALRIADGEIVWHAPTVQDTCGSRVGCHTAQPGAVTAIPGVVFSGSLDGHIRAYATDTGRVIWDVDTVGEYDTVNGVSGQGGGLNGPGATIVGGTLYVSSGYSFLNYMPGNVLLAFSVNGQ